MIQKEKLLLIIQREYLTRLKSKIFIVSTILAPVVMILLLVLPAVIQTMSGDRVRQFLVFDETGVVGQELVASDSVYYQLTEINPDSLRQSLMLGEIEGYLVVPHELLDGKGSAMFYHGGTAGMTVTSRIRSDVQRVVRDIRLDRLDTPAEVRQILTDRVETENLTITPEGEEAADSDFYMILGFIMGFIIYGAMFGYGAVIMRSVMEEKTSRIVEVVASSVRPFELLVGKVTGVAMLGLTQFVIWAAAGAVLMFAAGPVIALFIGTGPQGAETAAADVAVTAEAASFSIPAIGPMIWISFVLFFLLGFLIYSSLFAAVGSAVDQESDSQQLQLPIIMLIIIPLMFLFPVSDDPASRLAVTLSMIPFFAPILMPVRMAVLQIPFWQFGVTILIMVLTFTLLMWMSARIYRTGILMYGKKATFRELWRWMREN